MSNKRERVFQLDGYKPIELMTEDERNAHFLSRYDMTYDEWREYYKDDTPEKRRAEAKAWLKTKRMNA